MKLPEEDVLFNTFGALFDDGFVGNEVAEKTAEELKGFYERRPELGELRHAAILALAKMLAAERATAQRIGTYPRGRTSDGDMRRHELFIRIAELIRRA